MLVKSVDENIINYNNNRRWIPDSIYFSASPGFNNFVTNVFQNKVSREMLTRPNAMILGSYNQNIAKKILKFILKSYLVSDKHHNVWVFII